MSSFSLLADYSDMGVINMHHNIDPGKNGVSLSQIPTTYFESIIMEVDKDDGHVLKTFNMAHIISPAMIAGGDDPSQFVFRTDPTDWFHNNGAAYNRADDSLIVSSRENFVICLDYKQAPSNGFWAIRPKMVPISVFEKICADGRARQPCRRLVNTLHRSPTIRVF